MWYFLTGIVLYFLSLLVFKQLAWIDYNEDDSIASKETVSLYLYQYVVVFIAYLLAWPLVLLFCLVCIIFCISTSYIERRDKDHYDSRILNLRMIE